MYLAAGGRQCPGLSLPSRRQPYLSPG